jgi:hypothetical protein
MSLLKRVPYIWADGELRLESLPNGPLTLTMDEIYEDVIFRLVPHSLT